MPSKMRIDGEGSKENFMKKLSLSKRARQGKLSVEKSRCPYCQHHKVFKGNIMTKDGQDINKCCRCKKEIIK